MEDRQCVFLIGLVKSLDINIQHPFLTDESKEPNASHPTREATNGGGGGDKLISPVKHLSEYYLIKCLSLILPWIDKTIQIIIAVENRQRRRPQRAVRHMFDSLCKSL